MTDVEEVDVADSIRATVDERASRGVQQATLPVRDVFGLLAKYGEVRDELAAAQRTIAFLQKTALLAEAYELGRLAGVAEAEKGFAERLAAAGKAVGGLVDDLAQGGTKP